MSFFSSGVSAINAAQMGLTTTGQNISNANTAGYHLQSTVQSAAVPILTGSGFLGQGVQVDTVMRAYNGVLDNQVQQAQTLSTGYDTYQSQISQIDNILADPNIGLSPSLQGFFSAVATVAANPQDIPSRQTMISAGAALVTSFQTLSQQMSTLQAGVGNQIGASVVSINSLAQQISAINMQIVSQSGGGHTPNDLLDARSNLLSQLSQQVGVTVINQSDGGMNIYMGGGQPLVLAQHAYTLAAVPSSSDPTQTVVAYQSGSTATQITSSNLTGGTLGGLLSFQQVSLIPAQNALGQVAMSLAQSFNNQHALGLDLNGTMGGNFFTVPSTFIQLNANNAGNGVITATLDPVNGAKNLTASDYTLSYDGATSSYNLTRLSDKTVTNITSGTMAAGTTVDGIMLQSTAGAPINGDSYLIEPTRKAASLLALSASINTTTIAAAAPILASVATTNTGNGTITPGVVDASTQPPVNAALLDTVNIVFTSATTYDVNDVTSGSTLVSGAAYVANGTISWNGWNVQISGTPVTNDTFKIAKNTGGVGDNRNALLLGGLQTANTMAANPLGVATTTFQGVYNQLVTQVGSKTAEVMAYGKAQTALMSQAQAAQQTVSGVNLDQEAANLMRYQQAYQAAGKLLQMSSTLFTALLQAT